MSLPITHKTRRNLKAALAFMSLSKVQTYFQRHSGLLSPCLPRGLTALHLVCMENRLDVLQMLVTEYQAALDVVDQHGNSLSAWAKLYRNREIAEFISERTAATAQAPGFIIGNKVISAKKLDEHFVSSNPREPIDRDTSLKNLFRMHKSQTYQVLNRSVGISNHGGGGMKYGLRKGFVPLEKEVLESFVRHFVQTERPVSLALVLDLIPDKCLDSYFERGRGLAIVVEKYADRLSPDVLWQISTNLKLGSTRRFTVHCLSKALFSIKNRILNGRELASIEKNNPFEPIRCEKPCRSSVALLILLNHHQEFYKKHTKDVLKQLATLCLHDNGVLNHFQLLEDSGSLPAHKTSLDGTPVNFIVNLDMLKYHALITTHYCDYQVAFDFSHFSAVHRESLVPAIRLFESLYPQVLRASVVKQMSVLVDVCLSSLRVPLQFLYYLDDRFNIYQQVVAKMPEASARKRTEKVRKHGRWRVLLVLHCRERRTSLMRLPISLVRYLLEFI